MISNALPPAVVRFALFAALLAWAAPADAAAEFVFTYIQRHNDDAYQAHRAYTGLALRTRHRPIDGVRTALRESKVPGRAIGMRFKLNIVEITERRDAVSAIREVAETSNSRAFILDLPLDDMRQVARQLAKTDLVMFNPRHDDGVLRNADCAPGLFHTLPSRTMLMDGLSQYLRHKKWLRVLVLQGEHARDSAISATFQSSAAKYGLQVIDVRPFKLGNDPRNRDQTNIPLLTGGDYDVVFLADSIGEFGRYVPYQTRLPRPVVGSHGLRPGAWHWTWERYGAPQLNQRFDRRADRRMEDPDWAAWAAVKSMVEAVVRTESTDISVLREYLTSDNLILDVYKGTPASYRSWDNQLRQPVLLHTHDAVIARAPLEGYLHQTNTLDTLGRDRQNSGCGM